MTTSEPTPTSDLAGILTALIDGQPNEEQLASLESLLADDSEALVYYRKYMRLCALLEFERIKVEECEGHQVSDALAETESVSFKDAAAGHAILLPTFVTNAYQGVIGYFSQEIPFSLLISTIVTGLGLLVGSLVYVTHHKQVADGTHRSTPLAARPYIEFVGRVTGLADVQWADINTSTECGNGVPLGRKYTLSSGLLEIAYNTGAKVILQGPCTYEVESRDGGFLSIGKLTARLDNAKPQAADSKSSLSPLPSPLFTIKTPTAVVTDLGTEFGVEVDKEGMTSSYVFQGVVRFQAVSKDGTSIGESQLLRENQSARIVSDKHRRAIVLPPSEKPANFVRAIPRQPQTPESKKMFDLVDVVAGGDGFSGKRGASIDPTTGRRSNAAEFGDPKVSRFFPSGDGKYHRVKELPFVDGVFIPDGSKGPVQVNSAGHLFVDCPSTENRVATLIWAGGEVPVYQRPIQTTLGDVDYAQKGHGLLFLHPNVGITFNLDAIRKANSGWTIKRFLAMAGNTEAGSNNNDPVYADIWVLIDGKVQFRRWQINSLNGIFSVSIPIKSNDRFLTLASTDGGNKIDWDRIVFGDPRLELVGTSYKQASQKPTTKGGS